MSDIVIRSGEEIECGPGGLIDLRGNEFTGQGAGQTMRIESGGLVYGEQIVFGSGSTGNTIQIEPGGRLELSGALVIGTGESDPNYCNEVLVSGEGAVVRVGEIYVGHEAFSCKLSISDGAIVECSGKCSVKGRFTVGINHPCFLVLKGAGAVLDIQGGLEVGQERKTEIKDVECSASVSNGGVMTVRGGITVHSGSSLSVLGGSLLS